MSFTITDTELAKIIQDASLAAAEQAAKNAVAELIARQNGTTEKPSTPVVQQASEEEARKAMEAMIAICGGV